MTSMYENATPRPWAEEPIQKAMRLLLERLIADGEIGVHGVAALFDGQYKCDAALIAHAVNNIERLEAINAELLEAAKTFLSGLNARIDAASSVPGGAVPVFAGIAMLHDAIGHAEREGGSDADA